MVPPVVSYIVAAYNHAKFIEELLQSLATQTFCEIEIIVVDDGSSDGTLEIAQRLAATDPRIAVYAQPNRGVVAARNAGVRQSSAPYISVIDSDEIVPGDRTAKMVRVLEADPTVALVYGNVDIIGAGGEPQSRFFDVYPVIPGSFSEELFSNYCFVPAGGVMFRRDALERTGFFWGPGPSTDYLKWIEIGMAGKVVCLLHDVLGSWRLHGGNVSQGNAATRCQQYHDLCGALIELTEKHPDFARKVGRVRQRHRYGRCFVMAGFYAGLERDWRLARREFRKALSYERSPYNTALWVSTLPLINFISTPLYRWAGRKFLAAAA